MGTKVSLKTIPSVLIGVTSNVQTQLDGKQPIGNYLAFDPVTINSNTNLVAGKLYACDTSGGAFTGTLPAPTANAYIGIYDSTGSFNTNNFTIAPHATDKIQYLNANYICYSSGAFFWLYSNGTDWFIF